jgi:hypothetical protein
MEAAVSVGAFQPLIGADEGKAGMANAKLETMIKAAVPQTMRRWLRRSQQRLTLWPPLGCVRYGNLRRLQPVSRAFGTDRGQCVDRHYIEAFLGDNRDCIRGRVLEIGDPEYTRKFGGSAVTRSDVLHAVSGNPQATLVGDLATGEGIPENAFDCMILTQTFLCIYDVKAAVRNAYRALKPKGVLLVTIPGISQISRYDMDRWGDFWRFTDASSRRLFGEVFGESNVDVHTHGNVLVACAFLQGISAGELTQEELDYRDPDYQVTITVRAMKGA